MFCRRPFEQFYVAENGDVHLCCPEWIAMPAGNVLATPPLEIWRGKVAHRIRQSILDQSFRHCTGCPFLPGPAGCVTDVAPTDLPIDRIGVLTLAHDPTCNLSCPSCRNQIRGKTPRSKQIQDILVESRIFELVDILCSSGSGDPLAAPLYWELLEKLPPDEYPKLRLRLQTNGVLLDERAWAKLGKNADRLEAIYLSVDAASRETYDQNRRGGDWDALLENLAEIKRRRIPLQLNMVVQANNYREMVDFVEMARYYGASRAYFSALENWGTYSDEEYLRRAVHESSHPDHPDLLVELASPLLRDPSFVTLARLPRP